MVKKKEQLFTPAPAPFTPAFQSIPGQTPPTIAGGSSRPPIIHSPGFTTEPGEGVQGVNANDFIANRENLINQFKSLGHTDVAAKRLANQSIAQQLDIQAGAKPDMFGNTNQQGPQIQAGALGQARERAKAEVGTLGSAESNIPTEEQVNAESSRQARNILIGVGAAILSHLLFKGSGISKATHGLIGLGVVTGIERQGTSDIKKQFTNSKDLIDETTNAMEKGLISWSDGMSIINEQMLNINIQERTLKARTSDNLASWIGGGNTELADIQKFRTDFGLFTAPRLQNLGIVNQRQQIG